MSATDTIRAMLDERGVEWDYGITGSTTTKFRVNGIDLTFTPMRDGLVCSTILTPEQAIEATLGRGDTYTCDDVESAFVRGYSLGTLPVGSDPQWDENVQTVDEHMADLGWVRKATLGRGECTDTGRYCFMCSECGWTANEPHHAFGGFWPNYCPSCGAKVVRA